jgi:cell wall-associated NlpC family hydrolase
MLKPTHLLLHLPRGLRAGLLAGLLILTTGAAQAAPEAPQPGDAVLHLLKDKGLLPDPAQLAAQLTTQMEASPVLQQVRDTASDLVLSAMNFLGVRYRRGGVSAEQGFDCSGFTRYVFENSVGLVLPRRADQQARDAGLKDIQKDELRPGDLVFFNTMRRAFSHVGIYVGEGKFIHAPRAGGEVRVEDMRAAYWTKRFNGARRAEMPAPQGAVQP